MTYKRPERRELEIQYHRILGPSLYSPKIFMLKAKVTITLSPIIIDIVARYIDLFKLYHIEVNNLTDQIYFHHPVGG